jgi:ATP-binding cassette subfamily C (CFTR/MRP) protein 4
VLASRGFGFFINIIAILSAIFGIFLALSINENSSGVGQTIIYLVMCSDYIQWGIRQRLQLDVAMNSA